MNETFKDALDTINAIKHRAHWQYLVLSGARALAMAMIVMSLWFIVEPARPLIGMILGALTFGLLMSFTSYARKHHVNEDDFILSLDMNHQTSLVSPFIASKAPSSIVEGDWRPRLQREIRRVQALETRRLSAIFSSLMIPALAALLLWFKSPPSLTNVLAEAQDVMSLFDAEKSLEILTGSLEKESPTQPITLSGKAPLIKLLPQNMVRLTLNTGRRSHDESPPSIVLTPTDSTVSTAPATFQMQGRYDKDGRPAGWTLDFAVDRSSELSVKSAVGSTLVKFEVHRLPVPEVGLSLAAANQDPWPDNVLVPLTIKVAAHHPLKKIVLLINSKGKISTETVTSVYGDVTTVIDTDYKLNLEPYMSDDVLEFEIVAQATDSAQPQPLTGSSNPVLIRAASAYGRYKATLATLNRVKSYLDEASSNLNTSLNSDANRLASNAAQQAESSPFFDTLDRVQIAKIVDGVADLQTIDSKQRPSRMVEITNELANFLFEHETLDDRERDRDFFIAARTFSRVMERPKALRPMPAEQIAGRMKTFLDQRMQRWKLRVERLPEGMRPPSWSKIRDQHTFHAGISDTLRLDREDQASQSQASLSKTTNFYKTWLDELESKEDEYRQKKEREQQQGLANARNELRELQQRQDQISTSLDRASSRQLEDLTTKWQSARPQQNSNIKQAKDLLEQLKAMSPESGQRLSGAIAAMEEAVSQGNKSEFQIAESAADAAGRLLRDAEQSAARRQQQQASRGRRKRAAGDDYYGNAMVGGDVEFKSEYQVDARYREDVLRDVLKNGDSSEDKALLENYLRKILR